MFGFISDVFCDLYFYVLLDILGFFLFKKYNKT